MPEEKGAKHALDAAVKPRLDGHDCHVDSLELAGRTPAKSLDVAANRLLYFPHSEQWSILEPLAPLHVMVMFCGEPLARRADREVRQMPVALPRLR